MATKQQVIGQAPQQDRDRGAYACEPFVDADLAAEFLMVKRKTILEWARSSAIPAHRFGRGKRVVWRFRISELAGNESSSRRTMAVRQS
jgi:excisionase family DNA binding protein